MSQLYETLVANKTLFLFVVETYTDGRVLDFINYYKRNKPKASL